MAYARAITAQKIEDNAQNALAGSGGVTSYIYLNVYLKVNRTTK